MRYQAWSGYDSIRSHRTYTKLGAIVRLIKYRTVRAIPVPVPGAGRDNYRVSDSGPEIIGRIEGETWTYISRGGLFRSVRSFVFRPRAAVPPAGVLQFTTTSPSQIASRAASNNAPTTRRPGAPCTSTFCSSFTQIFFDSLYSAPVSSFLSLQTGSTD